MWQQFNNLFTGDWLRYGELFTNLQTYMFGRLFLLILTVVPLLFFLHYVVVGPKRFNHDGPQIEFFSLLARLTHWLAALFFSLILVSGLFIIYGKFFGGGEFIRNMRILHLISAPFFVLCAIPMFILWLREMLPASYDIKWFFIMGGYLSKEKLPVPAGKFNGGQKMWFWMATLGGFIMAYSGYILWSFQAPADSLRQMAIIHNFLGAALVALFLVHLYMSLFAIAGSLRSMISGRKPKEEVAILHSRYTP